MDKKENLFSDGTNAENMKDVWMDETLASSDRKQDAKERPETSGRETGRVESPPKRTTDQGWWRHNLLQVALFFLTGVVGSLALIGLVSLLLLPFRGNAAEAMAEISASEVEVQTPTLAPSPSPLVQPTVVTLMAVGENLIHDTVIDYGLQEDGSYDFQEMYRYVQEDIQRADIAYIQQETILISDPAQYAGHPAFGTPTEMADSLAAVGFDVVSHASNHCLDKGQPGIDDTLAAWAKHPEVTVLGIHKSQEDADQVPVVEKNGIKLAFLDYTYGVNGFPLPNEFTVDLLDEDHKERISEQIERARSMSDLVIVCMHDGTEDEFEADQSQKTWAQFFADEGVGLILGTHPHVIEPVEVLTGKDGGQMPCFYSLGNFLSSQKDNFNMLGAMAEISITKDAAGTYVSDYRLTPAITLIQGGGKNGYGYQFHTMHFEDYTEEMAQKHLRSGCTPEVFREYWNKVFPDYPVELAKQASGSAAEESAVEYGLPISHRSKEL